MLAAALAAYVMVKFYGVIFLGRPREPNLAHAKDAGRFERIALMYLAAGCVVLGLFPVNVIALLDPVNTLLLGSSTAMTSPATGCCWPPSTPTARATAR